LIAGYTETATGLAAAARDGEKLSDEDVYGMLERFQEGGVPEQRGGKPGGR
jgi:hypothetical protein